MGAKHHVPWGVPIYFHFWEGALEDDDLELFPLFSWECGNGSKITDFCFPYRFVGYLGFVLCEVGRIYCIGVGQRFLLPPFVLVIETS